MAKHIFTGQIDTSGEFELLETEIDYTFTADKVYTIQCLQPAYIRADDDVDGGNYIGNPDVFVQITYDGSTNYYIKTNGVSSVIVSEN